jgi:hypothetical protein
MQIKDLAIGDGYVCLMEGSTKVKFYALYHNYESGLNGKGRTLFCRESPATSGPWSSVGSAGRRNDIAWGITDHGASGETHTCSIYNWLTTTYFYKFAADVKGWMGKTKYLAHGTTFSTPIFTLSESESVYDLSSRPEGTLLSEAARKRLENIFTDFGENIWTRTQSKRVSYHHDSSDKDYYYDGVALSGVDSSHWGRFSTTYGHTYSWGYLPCFTLPETLYIDKDGFATENQPPEVTSDVGESGAALGEKNAPFDFNYTITDADGDTLTVTEKLDGRATTTRTGVASGTALTFEQTADAAGFQRVLNGNHTLTVEVSDGKGSTSLNATFTKSVTSASVTLAEPLTVEGDITVAVLQVTGSIPDDATFKVEVTNNSNDPSPVWQDATVEVKKGVNIVFTNSEATNGAAFNFRVSISRGASGTGGYIEAVSGAFQ